MQEDMVIKLESFGFTVNQAKVYLCIVQSGKTRVGKIAKTTQLHRQDIYKLLPKLEKMGLITRTIDKPFMIEAIPIEKALETLISKERKRSEDRIFHLENNLKEMIDSIQRQPQNKEETQFNLLTTDEAIRNRRTLTIKKLRREAQLISSLENIQTRANNFRDFLQSIAQAKAKTRLIVVTKENDETTKGAIEKIAPAIGQFTAKSIDKVTCKNYQIIDNKEIWIATQQKTETDHPCMLCTNDGNIIDVYKENFKKTWNHAKTVITIGALVSSLTFLSFSFIDLIA
ncbi:MAG: TrmB family transcriptional regulator [Bacillota bacterium]